MTLGSSQVRKWWTQVRQIVPKGNQKIAKGSQREPKGPKKNLKETKGQPKMHPKSIFGYVAKMMTKSIVPHLDLGSFSCHFSLKMH